MKVHVDDENNGKEEAFTKMLAAGEVAIILDARQPGVVVPQGVASNPALILKFSYRYVPGDAEVNGWGVRQTLSFGGISFRVSVPWGAVYAITSRKLDAGVEWAVPDAPPPAERKPAFRGLRLLN